MAPATQKEMMLQSLAELLQDSGEILMVWTNSAFGWMGKEKKEKQHPQLCWNNKL